MRIKRVWLLGGRLGGLSGLVFEGGRGIKARLVELRV